MMIQMMIFQGRVIMKEELLLTGMRIMGLLILIKLNEMVEIQQLK
jgi:hypothetical protein